MQVFDMMYTGTQTFKVTKPDGTEIEMYPYSMLTVDLAKLNQTLQTVATHANNAKTSETNAKNSATSASTSATTASSSATTAIASANAANLSATNAKTSETNAAKSATAAATSATSASISASNAKTSETKAKEYADSVNADTLLTKDDNLKSVANLAEAQKNMQIFRQMPDLTASINLDNLTQPTDYGVYACLEPVIATPENGYPIKLAGTLVVTKSLLGSNLQEYTTNTGRKFLRGREAGKWLSWTEYANLNQSNTFTGVQTISKTTGLFLQSISDDANALSSIKEDGTARFLLGITANGINRALVLRRSDEQGVTASQIAMYPDGGVILANLVAKKDLVISNTGKLSFGGSLVALENQANTFTSSQTIQSSGETLTLKSNNPDAHLFIRFRNTDGSLLGYCGRDISNGKRFSIGNQMVGTWLGLWEDGTLKYSKGEVLHTGNAGVVNGIGSNFVRIANGVSSVGTTAAGSVISPSLAGTWRIMSSQPFTNSSGTSYVTLYTRIA